MMQRPKGPWKLVLDKKKSVSASCHLLVFRRPKGFPDAEPGQFVSIRVSNSFVPLLRRPYSIMDLSESRLSLLVKVVGVGSSILASIERGDSVDAIGPLGSTHFPSPSERRAVFVAGGTGLAPLVFAVRAWKRKSIDVFTTLVLGASSREELLSETIEGDFSRCLFATMDGSFGHKGDVVSLCCDLVSSARLPSGILYSCGPREMIKALEERVSSHFKEHYTSLEAVMACGLGACRGCTIPVREGKRGKSYRTVCSDGTVFRASEIDWEEWDW